MLRSRHCALTKIMRTATSHASDAYDAIQPSRTRQRQRQEKRQEKRQETEEEKEDPLEIERSQPSAASRNFGGGFVDSMRRALLCTVYSTGYARMMTDRPCPLLNPPLCGTLSVRYLGHWCIREESLWAGGRGL